MNHTQTPAHTHTQTQTQLAGTRTHAHKCNFSPFLHHRGHQTGASLSPPLSLSHTSTSRSPFRALSLPLCVCLSLSLSLSLSVSLSLSLSHTHTHTRHKDLASESRDITKTKKHELVQITGRETDRAQKLNPLNPELNPSSPKLHRKRDRQNTKTLQGSGFRLQEERQAEHTNALQEEVERRGESCVKG